MEEEDKTDLDRAIERDDDDMQSESDRLAEHLDEAKKHAQALKEKTPTS